LRSINWCLAASLRDQSHPGQPIRAKTSCALLSIIWALFRKRARLVVVLVCSRGEERKGPKDPKVVVLWGSTKHSSPWQEHAPLYTPKENSHPCAALTNKPATVRTHSTCYILHAYLRYGATSLGDLPVIGFRIRQGTLSRNSFIPYRSINVTPQSTRQTTHRTVVGSTCSLALSRSGDD
jgi:hypothetical protein